MKYEQSVRDSFAHALEHLPEALRGDVWADKYKYLTDVTLARGALPGEGARILEIGGARSPIALMLRDLGEPNLHMVDRFDQPEAELRDGAVHPTRDLWSGLGIEAAECDVACDPLPYPDASFDVVVAVDIIEHFTVSPRHFFQEVRRILKPGGALLTGCPNVANLQNRIKAIFGGSIHPALPRWHDTEHYLGHVREYTAGEIEAMLHQAGFVTEQRRMGEEELDSVILDRAKLQRDRGAGDTRLHLTRPRDLAFYTIILLYYGAVKLVPGWRYFTRILARRPLAEPA